MPGYRVLTEEGVPHFMTCTTVAWAHVFVSVPYFDIVTDALAYARREKGLRLLAYAIMTNHFHLIAQAAGPITLPDIMRDLKRHTSKQIQALLRSDGNQSLANLFATSTLKREGNTEGKVWQDGYHPVALIDEDRYLQRLAYLENNPVRKGYVELPEHWRYSSARNRILGDQSVLEIDELEWD